MKSSKAESTIRDNNEIFVKQIENRCFFHHSFLNTTSSTVASKVLRSRLTIPVKKCLVELLKPSHSCHGFCNCRFSTRFRVGRSHGFVFVVIDNDNDNVIRHRHHNNMHAFSPTILSIRIVIESY